MNTIYRIVWNSVTGKWVVASELAKSRTKKAKRIAGVTVAMALGLSLGGHAAMAQSVAVAGESCTSTDGQVGTIDAAGY